MESSKDSQPLEFGYIANYWEPLAFALAGPAVHLVLFINGEWHLRGMAILIAHVLVASSIWFVKYQWSGSNLWNCLLELSLDAVYYMTTLCLSILTYRLAFHRLCGFPGPALASASKLWQAYHCINCKTHLLLDSLHKRYGSYVRTGTYYSLERSRLAFWASTLSNGRLYHRPKRNHGVLCRCTPGNQ